MIGDFVYENCNAPGTGAITPAGAPAGRRTFSQAFGTGKCYYVLDDGTQEEMGWTTVGATLTRNVIWTSAAGLTSTPINVTATARVYGYPPAEKTLYADEVNVWQAQARRLTNLLAGTGVSDAPRLDQVGWERIGTPTNVGSAVASVVISLPTGYDRFCIEWQGVAPVTTAATLQLQISENGGVSFLSGSTSYSGSQSGWNGTATNGATSSGTSLSLDNLAGTGIHEGDVWIDPTHWTADARSTSRSSTTLGVLSVAGSWAGSTRATHVAFFFAGSVNIAGGQFRLLGARFT